MKVDYGAVALIPKGEFNATEQYAVNDLVSYNGSSFIVKAVPPIGTLPTNTAYFTINASGTSPATSSTLGTVKPDNSTIGVDSNGVISVKSEVLDRVSSSEQALTVNLLNPTLTTRTVKGITITKNNDGSYTLDGTATEDAYFVIGALSENDIDQKMQYKLCGTPPTHVDTTKPYLYLNNQNPPVRDTGNGIIANRPIVFTDGACSIYIRVQNGFTCDNLVFKPMLTTNLSATYDDFVPFSGSSGKLDTDFKTLSEKIGNVGNTDLQSQLNIATQSIAQNTTDIATNAAGISALNTGLATKIGTYNDTVSRPVDQIVMNFQNEEFVLHDKDVDNWVAVPTFTKTYNAMDSLTVLDPNFTLSFAYLARYGHMCTLIIHGKFSANSPDTTAVLHAGGVIPVPCMTATCTSKDSIGNITTLSMEPDGNFRLWGAARANSSNLYSFYFTYLAGN